jgi:hypothetical protein
MMIKTKTLLFLIAINLLFTVQALVPQEQKKTSAKELLNMNMDSAYGIIEKMSKEESQEIVTQIRALYREKDPDIDKFYFLISHLEEIQAIEKEQSRLKSLNWVYALGFLLIMGLLVYIWLHQRKIQIQLERLGK